MRSNDSSKMVLDLLEISRADQDVDDRAMESVDLASWSQRSARLAACPPRSWNDRRRWSMPIVAGWSGSWRTFWTTPNGTAAASSSVTVTERQRQARLEVDDNGPGVPDEFRAQVFERFARGRHAGERGDETGSGLGLALVARHVRLHSGAVWVEDRPGGGARFVVELPAAAEHDGS